MYGRKSDHEEVELIFENYLMQAGAITVFARCPIHSEEE
jgi:hypothetical protein